ncbi:AhpC/TSA antioxidant enzyme-domain-containing protein, partial [Naematelia encephala]
MRELFEASILEVVDEAGASVKFGDLVRNRKTIVVFIRHWFCPLCAQYMNSILAEVSLDALQEAEVDLIIIGNGSAKMLNGYRNKAFKCPFKMYTDPTLALYRKLGLTRQTGNAGPDTDKGAYLIQTPLESTIQTIKRATQMPLRNPGHFTQLGGEFIFDSTLQVSYTHRMSTTRDHAPIRDVCEEAGVR